MPILDDIRFWYQVVEDSRRTLICSPELESRVKTRLAVLGLTGVVNVQVSPFAPDDELYLMDHHGLEASQRQGLQRAITDMSRRLKP